MRVFKKILSVLFAMVFMSLLFSHSVEAATPEAQIRKSVNGYIRSCRYYNLKKAKSYIHMKKDSRFYYIADPDWNKYIKKAQKRFHAEITDIRINGNTALVDIDYGGVDLYFCVAHAWHNELHEKGKIDVKRFNRYVIDEFKYALKHDDYCDFEYFMTIKLVKKKGKWKIEKPSKKIIRLFDGGATEAMREIIAHPFKFYFL